MTTITGMKVTDAVGMTYWLFFEFGEVSRPLVLIPELDFRRILEREGYYLEKRK